MPRLELHKLITMGGFYVHGFIYNISRRYGDGRTVSGLSRKSGGRGDVGARRVNPLTGSESISRRTESRVNTSTRAESESTPRSTESRVNTSTGTESESAPRRKTEVESAPRLERYPSQHFGGKRKPSQHLD